MDKELRNKWINAIRRRNWKPKAWERLCSDHFNPQTYKRTAYRRMLNKNAVPSIFDYGIETKCKTTKRSTLTSARTNISSSQEGSTSATEPCEVLSEQDFELSENMDTPPPAELPSHQSVESQTDLTVSDINFLEELREEAIQTKKMLQRERTRTWRIRKKVKDLDQLVVELKNDGLISEKFLSSMRSDEGEDFLHFIENELKPPGRPYSNEIKRFSLAIYFHSPAAYRHLRKYFSLPHERTVKMWLLKTDASPGFTSVSLRIIQDKILEGTIEPECVLILDSMSIRKQIIYDSGRGRNIGYVDTGNDIDDTRVAGEALVFLAAGLKRKWRYPVGYFFVGKFVFGIFNY